MRQEIRWARYVSTVPCCGANSAGCNVAINYANSSERAEKLLKAIQSTFPDQQIVLIQADVGQKSECERLVQETISQLGGIDVIISNAGFT